MKKTQQRNTHDDMDPDEKENLVESLRQFNKDVELIEQTENQLQFRSDVRERVNTFYNYYFQKELAKSNRNLTRATWVLALATIGFTVSEIYGAQQASDLVKLGFWLFITFVLMSTVFDMIFNIQEKVFSYFSRRKRKLRARNKDN